MENDISDAGEQLAAYINQLIEEENAAPSDERDEELYADRDSAD